MIPQKKSPKEFDSTICFTCFQPWVEAIRETAETEPIQALTAFFVLADYCLYGTEPAPECNPWGMAWPVIAAEARRSINNRRRGFGAEDTALTRLIINYHEEHPEASQRSIADALSCSVGKVNKVLKNYALSPISDSDTDTVIHSNVHNDNSNDIAIQNIRPQSFLSPANDSEIFAVSAATEQNGGAL